MEKVICRTTAKGIQSFYLVADKKEYFLFSQAYRVSVKDHFRLGILIDNCSNYSSHSTAVKKTLDKLHSYIRYIEKEYGIAVYKKTKQKNIKKSKCYTRARRCFNDNNFVVI